MKRALRRVRATRDIRQAAAYYLDEAGEATALRFVDAVAAAIGHIATFPAAGSQRYAFEFGFEQLRFWQVRGFPYLVFYVEEPDAVVVWRVLHAERDLATAFDDPAADG